MLFDSVQLESMVRTVRKHVCAMQHMVAAAMLMAPVPVCLALLEVSFTRIMSVEFGGHILVGQYNPIAQKVTEILVI